MENLYNAENTEESIDQNGVYDKPQTENAEVKETEQQPNEQNDENVSLLYDTNQTESFELIQNDDNVQVMVTESQDGSQTVVSEDNIIPTENPVTEYVNEEKTTQEEFPSYSEDFLQQTDANIVVSSELKEPVSDNVGDSCEVAEEIVQDEQNKCENSDKMQVECTDNDTNDNIKEKIDEPQQQQQQQEQQEEVITGDVVNEHNIVHYAVVEQVDGTEPVEIIGHLEGTDIEEQAPQQNIVYIEEYDESAGSVEGTVVQLQHIDGDGNIYLEHVNEMEEKSDESPKKDGKKQSEKPKKGRKSGGVPLHVLGRNISYPAEPVINGKLLPKPRLGVKVPYRNLTSQIVTREEIQREVMKRARLKQEQVKKPSGDFLFARRLTKRLAAKLGATTDAETSNESGKSNKKETPSFENNSDLLAVLEGEDDLPSLEKEKISEEQAALDKKAKEREIALQQLEELPNLTPKQRPIKRRANIDLPMPVLKKMPSSSTTVESEEVEHEEGNMSPNRMEVKTNVVLKTYSRKRKLSEENKEVKQDKKSPIKSPESATLPPNTYVTKSSRVIKKKIIWDPDESANKGKNFKLEPVGVEKKTVAAVEKKPASPQKVEKVVEKSPIKKIPTIIKVKKRLTEVDKLLMDEGAVNMLYDVKNTDDSPDPKKKKSVISLDKAHKELLKRTNEIKNDLQQNKESSSKSLRKKEVTTSPSPSKSTTVARKLSKDSRSSLHTPPASPAFNYNQHAEGSRIIRRRSSSSFSSDGESEDNATAKKKSESTKTRKSKRTAEVTTKEEKKEEEIVVKVKTEPEKPVEVKEKKPTKAESKYGQYKTFDVKKTGKLVSITLNYANQKCYYTVEVLKELSTILKQLNKEKDVYVVLLTSNGEAFSLGIDYTYLISNDEEERKKKATELSTCVKDFLKCLLHFSKILVAGIQGQCVGLAVTMLPLFDMVVASDAATFSAPYATLGCMAEGGFLLTVPYITNHGLAAELLYAAQQLKADDAFRRGLVTKLCWPEKYTEELKNLLTSVAGNSKQSLEAMKVQLRHYDVNKTETNINGETKQWIENWTSLECQKNFKNILGARS